MGDLVSLNRVRKAKVKADRATQAAANRAAFGRTKAEKDADRAEAARRDTMLDGAKREE